MRETIADITKAVLDFTGTEHPEHPMDIRYPLVIIDRQGRTWACRYWGGYYYQCMDDPNLTCLVGGLVDHCKSREPRVWDDAAEAQVRKVVEFNPYFDTPAQEEIVDLRCAGKGSAGMDGGGKATTGNNYQSCKHCKTAVIGMEEYAECPECGHPFEGVAHGKCVS